MLSHEDIKEIAVDSAEKGAVGVGSTHNPTARDGQQISSQTAETVGEEAEVAR